MSRRYLASLDIGTHRVRAVIAGVDSNGSAHVMGVGVAPSRGYRGGVVLDMEAASEDIRQAVRQAEAMADVQMKAVYLGMDGTHVEFLESYGATGIKGGEVSERDVQRAIEAASAVYVSLDREVLHIVPAHYTIDGQRGIVRPLGMSGVRLEVNVSVITVSHAALENIMKCCGMAGLEVIETVFSPLATHRAVTLPHELESGVAVIDIGEGTTKVVVYKAGVLSHADVLLVGGNYITQDIAIGMKTSRHEAARIKERYGYAAGEVDHNERITITLANGELINIPRSHLRDIIFPRCNEIFSIVRERISDMKLYSMPTCVVLTGGTAALQGIDRVAEACMGLPVRYAVLNGLDSFESAATDRGFSVAVGLVNYGLEIERNVYEDLIESMVGRGSRWLKGLWAPKSWRFGTR